MLRKEPVWVLGAGMTGLAASLTSGAAALEAEAAAGGICRSYFVASEGGAYRFEVGGGHWVFGGDPMLRRFLDGFGAWKAYERRASVYFPETGRRVAYPLQSHLEELGGAAAARCRAEMESKKGEAPRTMAEWLEWRFGKTLNELFFGPFHELYTAGLYTEIEPQDGYKTPEAGVAARAAGYNQTFLYPEEGLAAFADRLAECGRVETGRRVVRVDGKEKAVILADGRVLPYGRLISTLPLDLMLGMAGVDVGEEPGPATSVLVVNLGGVRGARCPQDHWVYVPRSRSGFHRVGFYSNVDESFLPAGSEGRVSVYVEKAARRGNKPAGGDLDKYVEDVGEELREWGFMERVEAVSVNWVETGYTWNRPGSRWREEAVGALREEGIEMTGRYGKWRFQGMTDSLRDGLLAGALAREWGRRE